MDALITALSLLGFLALTAGTALFVAAEFSLTALERSAVDRALEQYGDARAHQVAKAHRSLSFQLSGAQLGITITTLVTGYLAEPVLAGFIAPLLRWLHVPESVTTGIALALALIVATSLSMIYGELVPKNLAITHPMGVARYSAGPQIAFSSFFRYAITALNHSANWFLRRIGIEPAGELASARSPSELGALVRNSAKSGALDADTARLVNRSLLFGERTAADLMTTRSTVDTLEVADSVNDLLQAAHDTGHSRFPIVRGDLDDTVGMVHVKQAFRVAREHRDHVTLESLAVEVPVVPGSLDGDELLTRLRAHGLQVALVVDEYGGSAGIVTMEDLVEEILGDVRDEYDESEDVEAIRTGSSWSLSGLLRIDELAAHTGYHAPEGEYETLGGLVMDGLGRIPQRGDSVLLPTSPGDRYFAEPPVRWSATVVKMDGRRVAQVELRPIDDSEGEAAGRRAPYPPGPRDTAERRPGGAHHG